MVTTVVFEAILNISNIDSLSQMESLCKDCTAEKTCTKCTEADQQADGIAKYLDTLPTNLQTIAFGIVAGLHQIKEDQADNIKLFISKVKIHGDAHPEIKRFLENIVQCYLTPWEFDLVKRCLQSLNAPTTNLLENES